MKPPASPSSRWFTLVAFLHRRAGLLLLCAGFVLFAASALVLRGGMIHPEIYLYLPYYLDARPLAARVFDLGHTDANMYSARELSYLFDLFDAHVIAWSVDLGRPHFLSACHYTFCGLGASLMWYFARHRLRLPRPATALLVLAFLTTPVFFLSGGYFRSAKSGAVLGLIACGCCVAPAFFRGPPLRRFPWAAWSGTLLTAVLMGLFDRQGFFFVLLLAGVLFLHAVLARDRPSLLWLAAPLLALAALQFYNQVLGLALTEHFTGHRPSMEFQRLPWGDLLHSKRALFDSAFYGPTLMLDNLRFLLGSVPVAIAVALVAFGVWRLGPHWPWPARAACAWTPAQLNTRGRLMLALLPLALIAMNALMVLRLKAIVGLDFRRMYYGLPSVAFLWLLLACAVAATLRFSRLRPRTCWLVLTALVTCNLVSLVEHRHIVRLGLYRDSYRTSPEIISALRHLDRVPAADAHPPYWPTVAAGQTTEPDGIVRFFRHRQLARGTSPPPTSP